MFRINTIVLLPALAIAAAACDPGSSGSSETTTAAAAATSAPDAEPTVAASGEPEECVTSRIQTPRFAGGWNVEAGEAWFGAQSTRAGTNDITLRESGNSLTMTIVGFPTIRMQRVPVASNYSSQTDTFRWNAGGDVAVSSDAAALTFGCADMNRMARFVGQARIDADGVSSMATFRLVMTGPDDGILHWEMPAPMASSGLFNISRVQ